MIQCNEFVQKCFPGLIEINDVVFDFDSDLWRMLSNKICLEVNIPTTKLSQSRQLKMNYKKKNRINNESVFH